jgi:hypothetical protein
MSTKDAGRSEKAQQTTTQDNNVTSLIRREEEGHFYRMFEDVLAFRYALLPNEKRLDTRPQIAYEKFGKHRGVYDQETKKIFIGVKHDDPAAEWVMGHEGTHAVQDLNNVIERAMLFAAQDITYPSSYKDEDTISASQSIMWRSFIEPEACVLGWLYSDRNVPKPRTGTSLLETALYRGIKSFVSLSSSTKIFDYIAADMKFNDIGSIPEDVAEVCYEADFKEGAKLGNKFIQAISSIMGFAFAALVLAAEGRDEKKALEVLSSGPAAIISAIRSMKLEDIERVMNAYDWTA